MTLPSFVASRVHSRNPSSSSHLRAFVTHCIPHCRRPDRRRRGMQRTGWGMAVGLVMGALAGGALAAPSAATEPRVIAQLDGFESRRAGEVAVFRQLAGSRVEVIAAPDGDV